jgi:hypothetical protein
MLSCRLPVILPILIFTLGGCVQLPDPALQDPSGPEVAIIRGSSGQGPDGVDIYIAAINDGARYPGRSPTRERRLEKGQRRVTVFVPRFMGPQGLTEFQFRAEPRHRYEVRSKTGGGFYTLELFDVTDPEKPSLVLSGKFGTGPLDSSVVDAPFIVTSPQKK